jgi:2-hydroxychromene-2-carboxylate isomerase
MKRKAYWYFDYISPYAYLQFHQMPRFRAHLDVSLEPVLFAGLLNAWGQLGPAEIPEKRLATYKFCTWQAERMGLPFRTPPTHPYNPLATLRLTLARGSDAGDIEKIFDAIWGRGLDIADTAVFEDMKAALGPAANGEMDAQQAKQALRDNTDAAVAKGVYGVPTFAIEDETAATGWRLFWGFDAGDWMLDWLDNPGMFDAEAMRAANDCVVGATRRRP